MIDTAEKRRAAIDFGKGPRGTGMPIPSSLLSPEERAHVLNLYPGIATEVSFFFFWRNRRIQSSLFGGKRVASSTWKNRIIQTTSYGGKNTPSSTWGKPGDADEDIFIKAPNTRDS